MWLQAAKTGDEENLDNEELCIVCWERLRDVIFRHCMHMVRFRGPNTAVEPIHKWPWSFQVRCVPARGWCFGQAVHAARVLPLPSCAPAQYHHHSDVLQEWHAGPSCPATNSPSPVLVWCTERLAHEGDTVTCDGVWLLQCTCQSCAKDIMAAGAPCPLCRTNIERTITVRL